MRCTNSRGYGCVANKRVNNPVTWFYLQVTDSIFSLPRYFFLELIFRLFFCLSKKNKWFWFLKINLFWFLVFTRARARVFIFLIIDLDYILDYRGHFCWHEFVLAKGVLGGFAPSLRSYYFLT